MNVRPEIITLTRDWMIKSAHDLKNAEHTLTLSDAECPFDTACFHAQQCVKKSLKALLTVHQINFQKTHDLAQLLYLCKEIAPGLIRELIQVKSLTHYAVETRYPGDTEPIDRSEAKQAIRLARKARKAVQRKLEKVLV